MEKFSNEENLIPYETCSNDLELEVRSIVFELKKESK